MFEFIKTVFVSSIKDNIKEKCVEAIEITLYGKQIHIFQGGEQL